MEALERRPLHTLLYAPMTDSTYRHGTVTLDSPTGARGNHTLIPGLWETLQTCETYLV